MELAELKQKIREITDEIDGLSTADFIEIYKDWSALEDVVREQELAAL